MSFDSNQADETASLYQKLLNSHFLHPDDLWILISVDQQKLFLLQALVLVKEYPVSTALNGTGCEQGSYQTPTGLHQIYQKIGQGEEQNRIFQAREPVSQLANIQNKAIKTGEDLITSRILWLSGLENYINFGGKVDTFSRYIYIHGTHEEGLIGKAVSHGCIRMKNKDVIDLFERVSVGTLVYIL